MNYEQLEILIKAMGVIIAFVITYIIKPYIESKVSESELNKLENYIKTAVRCAEQIYTPNQWVEKKNYVTEFITKILHDKVDLSLSPEEIDTLIEGFVREVKKG